MSDTMLFGVLGMPYEMAMESELSRRQFYSRAQEAVARIKALEAEPPLPATPEEVIAFIGSHYDSMEEHPDLANVRYTLTVHDLLSAFQWWKQ